MFFKNGTCIALVTDEEGEFYEDQSQTLLLGGLLAGSLVVSAVPASADDFWHWRERDHRWERRAERSEQRDLDQARQQLEYDRSHRANRRRIAQDEARIRDLERDVKDSSENDRRGNWD